MVVWNYSRIVKREKRVYSVFNTTISQQGISTQLLTVVGVTFGIFTVFGVLFCLITGKFWYNLVAFFGSTNGGGAGYGIFFLVFVGLPIALGVWLNNYKIQNYRAIDYVKLYFEPKKPRGQDGKETRLIGYKIHSFVERL